MLHTAAITSTTIMSRYYSVHLLIVVLLLSTTAFSQGVADIDFDATPPIPIQEPCNPADSKLDAITHKFRSNCGPRQWCKPTAALNHDPLLGIPTISPSLPRKRENSAQIAPLAATQSLLKLSSPVTTALPSIATSDFGLCVDKGCRRDEFPFGYRGVAFEALPPQCGADQYCPDDESSCQPLLALGQPCQLNRDGALSCPTPSCNRCLLHSPQTHARLTAPPLFVYFAYKDDADSLQLDSRTCAYSTVMNTLATTRVAHLSSRQLAAMTVKSVSIVKTPVFSVRLRSPTISHARKIANVSTSIATSSHHLVKMHRLTYIDFHHGPGFSS
jgi:hypothetical protein